MRSLLERQERQMVNHPGKQRCPSLSCAVTAFGNPENPTGWQRDLRRQGKTAERCLLLVRSQIPSEYFCVSVGVSVTTIERRADLYAHIRGSCQRAPFRVYSDMQQLLH